MAGRVLKPHGHALIKVFQGAGFQELVQAPRRRLCQGEAAETCGIPLAER